MAELISSQTAAANSADIVLLDGASATLNLKAANGEIPTDAGAAIQIKGSDSNYVTLGSLNRAQPAANVVGPGTFRVAKGAAATAFGVDKS